MSQRLVNDNFWTDGWVEDRDPSEKLIFIYLLTNPLCNIAGIYEIKLKRISFETGYEKDMVDKILDRFVQDGKILRYDDWILLVNFAKNQSVNPNVRKGMQRIIDNLPDKIKALKGFERLSHFTLLNLTLPNFTLPSDEEFSDSDFSDLQNSEIQETTEIEIEEKTSEESLEIQNVPPDPKKERADFLARMRKAVGVAKFKDENEWTEAGRILDLFQNIGYEDFTQRLRAILRDSFKLKQCNRLSYVRKEIESFIISPMIVDDPVPDLQVFG